MPTTGDTWIELATGQILDFSKLSEDFLERVRAGLAELRADIFGRDTTIGADWAEFTVAASALTLDATRSGTTPEGYRVTADHTDPAWSDVPFANVGATLYRIGARRALRPNTVTANTADGQCYYDQTIEDVGELGEPDAVSVFSGGLYIDVDADPDGLVGTGWTTAAPRPVVVWLDRPVTAGTDAIFTGEIEWDGAAGTHRITVPHTFGQAEDAPSTDPGDYRVLVRGPTITTAALADDPAAWCIGEVESGTFANTGQNLVPTWGEWLALFQEQHDNATGDHLQIEAHGVDLYGDTPGSQLRIVHTAHELASYMQGFEQPLGVRQGGTLALSTLSAPYHVRTTTPVAGTFSFLQFAARLPLDQTFTIRSLLIGAYIDNPSSTQKIVVELIKRSVLTVGVGAGTTIASWEATGFSAGVWAHRDTWTGPAFPFEVTKPGKAEALFWRVYFFEPNPAQVQVSHLEIEATATRIEPWR
jgi:hypothetical protein